MGNSGQTRPDLSFDTMLHSTFVKDPKMKHLNSLNKVVTRTDQCPGSICYRAMDLEKGNLHFLVFADASLGNLPETKHSVRGYLIFLTDGEVAHLITWSSNKVKRVVHSIFGAETIGCIDGVGMAIYTRQLLSEMLYKDTTSQLIPIDVLTDSKQVYDNVMKSSPATEKRLALDIAELQEAVQTGEVRNLIWIPTKKMLADCLTKKGVDCRELCGILDSGYFNLRDHLSRGAQE